MLTVDKIPGDTTKQETNQPTNHQHWPIGSLKASVHAMLGDLTMGPTYLRDGSLDFEVLIAVSCLIGSTISHGCFSILGEARPVS